MAILDSLILSYVARNDQFLRASRQSAAAVTTFERVTGGAARRLRGLFAGLGGALLAGGALRWLRHSAELADASGKLADRLGLSMRAVAGLQLASELAGVSTGELESNMTRMFRVLAEAESGTRSALRTLEGLKVTLNELRPLTSEERFLRMADALAAVTSKSRQLELALELFGKSGATMLNVTAEGAAGLRRAMDEAQSRGLVLTREQAAQAERANDAWLRVQRSITGLGLALSVEVAPAAEMIIGHLDRWVSSLAQSRAQLQTISDLINGVINAWIFLRDTGRAVVEPIERAFTAQQRGKDFADPRTAIKFARDRIFQPGGVAEFERVQTRERRFQEIKLRERGLPTEGPRVQAALDRLVNLQGSMADVLIAAEAERRQNTAQMERLISAVERGGVR